MAWTVARNHPGAGSNQGQYPMFAIIEDGGKQYRVKKGDTIHVEMRQLAESETTLEFDRVLMVGEGSKCKVGTPWIEGAKVRAKLDKEVRGPKLRIVKFKRRKGYRRHTGHRQDYLRVAIDAILA